MLDLARFDQRRVDAKVREGLPVAVWRSSDELKMVSLEVSVEPHLIGRAGTATVRLRDRTVSSSHAVIEVASPADVYVNDSGSLNGTFLNGVRVHRRVRLKDGSALRCGVEWVLIRLPMNGEATVAVRDGEGVTLADLPRRRLEVLWWLCEPMTQRGRPEPASRADLCAGLGIVPSTLGEHLRGAAEALGVLPGEGMRLRLANRAIQLGIGVWERPSGSNR
ncbi:MAG TPA: FHA domain-containing protein [Solirubrobacteraceae bacterium]|jgi:hypothetical protein|nr:FHA domain-containing protein [Solirubrobacteraceae bacterium]